VVEDLIILYLPSSVGPKGKPPGFSPWWLGCHQAQTLNFPDDKQLEKIFREISGRLLWVRKRGPNFLLLLMPIGLKKKVREKFVAAVSGRLQMLDY